ncbi:MAG: hypothetical protein DYG89_04965 [Caldilinea sp. CFX5]|nr:hypothetical protein [Caldilinea sp. CFX5]
MTLLFVYQQRLLVAGLQLIAIVLFVLQCYVRTLPPTPTAMPEADSAEAAWWGLWPATYLPTWVMITAAFLLVGWLVVWWCSELWSWPKLRIPNSELRIPSTFFLAAIVLLLLLAFYTFPIVHTRWGDAYLLSKAMAWPDPALRLTHSWQAPLDVFLHSQLWLGWHERFGWEDAIPVYRLLSPVAGLFYLLALWGLVRDQTATPGWLTFGLLTSLGVLQLFFGYIENYSFAAAGILLYLWLGLRVITGKAPLWLAASLLALTHAFHPSTVILAPSLLYVGWIDWQKQRQSQNKSRWPAVLSTGVAIVLPMLIGGLAVIGLMEGGGHGLAALLSTDRPGGGDGRPFVPLWAVTTRWEHYTMFSWLHLRDFLNQQLLVAPVVLPGLLLVALAGLRQERGLRAKKAPATDAGPSTAQALHFLLVAALSYQLFSWLWNPDYGGQRDWDLFSLAAIPAALLLATTLPRRFADPRYLSAGTIPLLMLQWFHLAAWIYQNTLPWDWPS